MVRKWILGLMASSALFLTACASGPNAVRGDGTGNTAEESETITIGSIFELSGPAAAYGNVQNNAVQLAAAEINEAGGINGKPIEIVSYDTRTDETETASLVTRVTTLDEAVAVIGPATTGSTQAAVPSGERSLVPVISPSATDDSVLTAPDGEVYEYGWRTAFTDSFQGRALALFSAEELDAERAVILADNSSDYAQGLTREFTEAFPGEVVSVENFTAGQQDFNAELTNINQLDYDVLFIPGYYEEGGPIIRQAREMGIEQPIVGPDGFGNEVIYDLAGEGNMDNIYYTSHFNLRSDDPEVVSFVENYREAFNSEPDMFSGLAYDTMNLIAQAIEEAGSTASVDINNALLELEEFEGITGTFTFDENHNPIKTANVVEIQGAEEVNVTQVDPGASE